MFKRIELLQLWFDETVARINRSLRRFPVFAVLLDTVDLFAQDQMSLLAASLTYYALLALFPLLLVLVASASFFVSQELAMAMVSRLTRTYLPGVEQYVLQILREVVDMRGTATVFGFVTLLWSASGVFDVVQQALDRAWHVQERRSFWLQRLFSIGVIGVLSVVLLSSILISSATLEFFASVLGDALTGQAVLREAANWIAVLMSFVVFFAFYKFFPHARVPWRAALIGAGVAAVSWQIAKFGYSVYLGYFARYNFVYGSLGAIIGLMFWGYISAMILLFCAELSARLGRPRETRQASAV